MKKHISPFASIISWCLMPNHFHFVVFVFHDEVELESDNLIEQNNKTIKTQSLNQSFGVLLSSYTKAIQNQEKITGSLFQKRTKAKLIFDEVKIEPAYWNTAFGNQINIYEGKSYLETCIVYIHQNPVYSGLVKSAEDWEFSSLRDFVGLRDGKLLDYDILKRKNRLILLFVTRTKVGRRVTYVSSASAQTSMPMPTSPQCLKFWQRKQKLLRSLQ